MRITTSMLRRNYMSGLSSALQNSASTRETVLSGRKYTRFSQDPFSASSAAVLERKYLRNESFLDTVKELQSIMDTQEDALAQISDIAETISKDYSVSAMNDVTGLEGRKSYAAAIRELQEEMVNNLNAQYGDRFVLAGNDALEAPFSLENGKLLYRGIDVETTDPDEQALLDDYAKEATYADVGFGMSFDENNNNEIISSTAFDYALPGLSAVGYGKTDDGTSKNMVVLLGQMADVLEQENFDAEQYTRLWDQFQEGANDLIDEQASLGIRSKSLETTETRLTDMSLTMTEQLDSLEKENPAYAIMNYSYAEYTYNRALKVGTGIIGQSLLDFLS